MEKIYVHNNLLREDIKYLIYRSLHIFIFFLAIVQKLSNLIY